MNTPHLVEALLQGLVLNDEACAAYPELGMLRTWAEAGGAPVPLQWALCATDTPLARGLIRHSVQALLDLLDVLDDAWDASYLDGCPLWHALQRTPEWLWLPDDTDDRHADIALLLERDASYDGNWQALIEALHRAGSMRWQWAIHRCRAMQRYEAEHNVNLRDLLASRCNERKESLT